MNKRNTHNMNKAFIGVKKYNKNYVEQQVNTDIQNVDYDNLNRKAFFRIGSQFVQGAPLY